MDCIGLIGLGCRAPETEKRIDSARVDLLSLDISRNDRQVIKRIQKQYEVDEVAHWLEGWSHPETGETYYYRIGYKDYTNPNPLSVWQDYTQHYFYFNTVTPNRSNDVGNN